jgi:hypothetical protein
MPFAPSLAGQIAHFSGHTMFHTNPQATALPMNRRRLLLGTAAAGLVASAPLRAVAQAAPMPIFDAHLHYSHDAWERLPPKDAIALLRKAGLKRAMVSSSSDVGTQMLYQEAPDLILPSLRPYRMRGELGTWMRDASVPDMLAERLAKYSYVAIGEFHIYGKDAELPVMRRVVELAKQHKIFLHSHSDADAIERQFQQDPGARILWAHSGFDDPANVRAMLAKHRNLWCDLAFRSDHATMGKVSAGWRETFLAYPDRFMVGTDTFTPERWFFVGEHANWTRAWLADLPRDVAERIGYRNGEALFGSMPLSKAKA